MASRLLLSGVLLGRRSMGTFVSPLKPSARLPAALNRRSQAEWKEDDEQVLAVEAKLGPTSCTTHEQARAFVVENFRQILLFSKTAIASCEHIQKERQEEIMRYRTCTHPLVKAALKMTAMVSSSVLVCRAAYTLTLARMVDVDLQDTSLFWDCIPFVLERSAVLFASTMLAAIPIIGTVSVGRSFFLQHTARNDDALKWAKLWDRMSSDVHYLRTVLSRGGFTPESTIASLGVAASAAQLHVNYCIAAKHFQADTDHGVVSLQESTISEMSAMEDQRDRAAFIEGR
jgi:hypothetical protein